MTEEKTSELDHFKNNTTAMFQEFHKQHQDQELPDALLSFCKAPECSLSAMRTQDERKCFKAWADDQSAVLVEYYASKDAPDPKAKASEVVKAMYHLLPNDHIKTWDSFLDGIKNFDPSKDFNSAMFGRRFPVGTISYIGARPGRGKTTMLVNLAMDAISKGKQVSFVTSEETTKQLLVRFVLRAFYTLAKEECPNHLPELLQDDYKPRSDFFNGVKNRKYAMPYTGALYHNAMDSVAKLLASGQLEIFEAYGASWDEMAEYLRTLESGRVVLLDYVQHLKMPDRVATQNRQIQIQEASHILADTAGQEGLIVISAGQFNRGDKDDEDEDTFSETSFREAGDIEQDGHILIGIGKNHKANQFFYTCMKDREAQHDNGARWLLDTEFKFSFLDGARDPNGDRVPYRKASSSLVPTSKKASIPKESEDVLITKKGTPIRFE